MKPLTPLRPRPVAPDSEHPISESGPSRPEFFPRIVPCSEFRAPHLTPSSPQRSSPSHSISSGLFCHSSFCHSYSESWDSLGQTQNLASVPPLQSSHLRFVVPDARPNRRATLAANPSVKSGTTEEVMRLTHHCRERILLGSVQVTPNKSNLLQPTTTKIRRQGIPCAPVR